MRRQQSFEGSAGLATPRMTSTCFILTECAISRPRSPIAGGSTGAELSGTAGVDATGVGAAATTEASAESAGAAESVGAAELVGAVDVDADAELDVVGLPIAAINCAVLVEVDRMVA